jgi:hypothetical protein
LFLTHKQFFEARFILKRPVRLGLVIGERLLEVTGALLLLSGNSLQRSQRMLDACTVPTVFSGLRCAGYMPAPRMNISGSRSSSGLKLMATLPLLGMSNPWNMPRTCKVVSSRHDNTTCVRAFADSRGCSLS